MPVMTKPGTVLLTCEPFAYTAFLKTSAEICDTCLYTAPGGGFGGRLLRRCSACRTVFYCSKDCQKKGWKDGHKFECHGMKQTKDKFTPGNLPRLLLGTLVKLQDGKDHFDLVKTEKGEIKRRFQDLISHSEEIKKDKENMEQVESMISIAKVYLHLSPNKFEIPGDNELLEICGRILINSFSITTDIKLGGAVYLAGSIFNHSCDEMASRGFEGTAMVIRSIKEIPEGFPMDKVTISYGDTLLPTRERRIKLKADYYFECQCDRCTTGLYDKEMRSVICSKNGCKNEIDSEDLNSPCGTCGKKKTAKEIGDIEKTTKLAMIGRDAGKPLLMLSLLQQKNFSEGHWLMINFFFEAFDQSFSKMNWEKAYDYGLKYLNGIRRYLHPYDKEIGRVSARMANVALFLNNIELAEKHLNEAKAVLEITSGPDSQYYKDLIFPLARNIEQAKYIKKKNISVRFGV